MKDLLAGESADVLAQLAWSSLLVGFDFDGTLAPIVADREAAQLRSRTALLFARVCELYPCAVISGRSRKDLRERLPRASVKYLVGNHGLEPGAHLREFEAQIARARVPLQAALAQVQGVELEDKRYSLALHYRKARSKPAAREAIVAAVRALRAPMRIIAGKQVVNVVPAEAPNKGDALLELRAREQADTALYVGDDVTDEDVFELDQPGRLLSVRVGRSHSSAAQYFVRDQRAVDRLLASLVSYRQLRARK